MSPVSNPIMVIMIGIQASGKSTYCRSRFGDGQWEIISLDVLHTRNKENTAISKAIAEKKNIVIDNTDPTREDRKRYIDMAKLAGYVIKAVFMRSRVQECIDRNGLRDGKARVPDNAIACTSNKLEMPEYAEGFSEILYVWMEDGDFKTESWRENNGI